MRKLTEWELDDQIKTRKDLVNFMWAAVDDVIKIQRPRKKEMQWLKIACSDFVRIAKQKGWVE